MAAFTPDQMKVLQQDSRFIKRQIIALYQVHYNIRMEQIALIKLLQKKGIFNADELKAEEAEARAAVAVDMATDPEFLAMDERSKREQEEEGLTGDP